jgi:hypothetical protein
MSMSTVDTEIHVVVVVVEVGATRGKPPTK